MYNKRFKNDAWRRILSGRLYALVATFSPKLYTYYYMAIEPYRC